MLPAEARCGIHPRNRALDVCSRCGCFVCAECVGSRFGTVLCGSCLERLRDPVEELPRIVVVALAGAILGFVLPPLAWASYVLSRIALRRHTGERALRYASIARFVSGISSFAWIFILVLVRR